MGVYILLECANDESFGDDLQNKKMLSDTRV